MFHSLCVECCGPFLCREPRAVRCSPFQAWTVSEYSQWCFSYSRKFYCSNLYVQGAFNFSFGWLVKSKNCLSLSVSVYVSYYNIFCCCCCCCCLFACLVFSPSHGMMAYGLVGSGSGFSGFSLAWLQPVWPVVGFSTLCLCLDSGGLSAMNVLQMCVCVCVCVCARARIQFSLRWYHSPYALHPVSQKFP